MNAMKVKFQLEKNILIEPAPLRESTGHGVIRLSYSKADYVTMMAENHTTIQMMNSGTFGSRNFCSRGLEGRTRLGSRRKLNIKRRARDAVLNEQQRQRDESIQDSEMISEVYKGFTRPCHTQAHRLGIRDYESVTDIFSRKPQTSMITKKDSTYGNTSVPANELIAGILSLCDDKDVGSVVTDSSLSMNQDMRNAAVANMSKASTAVKLTNLRPRLFRQSSSFALHGSRRLLL
jgi:hypothetical protein